MYHSICFTSERYKISIVLVRLLFNIFWVCMWQDSDEEVELVIRTWWERTCRFLMHSELPVNRNLVKEKWQFITGQLGRKSDIDILSYQGWCSTRFKLPQVMNGWMRATTKCTGGASGLSVKLRLLSLVDACIHFHSCWLYQVSILNYHL